MKTISGITVALLAACAVFPVHGQVAIGRFAGADITFEGLVQADADWYDSDVADLDGDPGDGDDVDHGLRNAQLYLRGKGPGSFDWVAGYDANAGRWLDANVRFRFGGGRRFVQAGQFKQPVGLEALSASRHNDFMSLAMATNAFTVGRRTGIAYSSGHPFDRTSGTADGSERQGNWGVTVSYFGRALGDGAARGNGFGVRGTWALFNAEDRILHLGLSHADYDTPAGSYRLRARPNADLTPVRLVDTGDMAGTGRVATTGAEGFLVRGPFKLQAEYMATDVERHGAGAEDFDGSGAYASLMWNITGQSWGYNGGEPATQVGAADGAGMWQLGVRYDVLDLDDRAVHGGRMEAWTLGVNWYWSRHLKIALNHVTVRSERDGIEDDPRIAEARLQVHW